MQSRSPINPAADGGLCAGADAGVLIYRAWAWARGKGEAMLDI